MNTKEKINQLFLQFCQNKWLFPSTWGDKYLVSGDFSFQTYFSDTRDHATIDIEYKNKEYAIKLQNGKIIVSHNLSHPFSAKTVLKFMERIKSFFSDTIDEQEEVRIGKIVDIKSTMRQLKKELLTLKRDTKETK